MSEVGNGGALSPYLESSLITSPEQLPLLAALGIAAVYLRRRRSQPESQGLSEAERARLTQLLDE